MRKRGTTWGGALATYVTYLEAAGRAEGTIRLHLHYLAQLRNLHKRPWSVTTWQLRELMATHGWKPETRKSCRSVLRGFYSWGHAEGLVDHNPALALEQVRVPQGIPKPTPVHMVRRLLLEADVRLYRMTKLGLAGLRRAEIAQVHGSDMLDDELLVHGKGGKERLVPIVDDELREWLRGLDGWAFPSPYGEHLTPGHVGVLLSRGLPHGWSGHSLRHRTATDAYDATGDLLAVMVLIGHSRPDVTRRYVALGRGRVRAAAAAGLSWSDGSDRLPAGKGLPFAS